VFDNRYTVDKRMMLRGEVRREGENLPPLLGLNDLVVHRGPRSPVLTMHIQVGESYAMSYRGDGVIVSTPTGSTGYALSAGGPIVHPHAGAILITPVCPHMLKERPMIVPDDESITIRLENSSACLSVEMDGQTGFPLLESDHVFVKASPYKATFIRMRDFKFFSLLQDKIRNGR
jgi:NAD+ kinase